MQGESILAIIILIVLFYSEWKARRTFNKETEKEYEERIAFYKRLPTMSREELEELRGEEDE